MAGFDTLIRPETLILSSSTGSNRLNIGMEVKTQYEYPNRGTARRKITFGIY